MTVKITKPDINLREALNKLNRPVGQAGEAVLRAKTPQEQQELIGVGRKNMAYNGEMIINQRAETPITGTNKFVVDRWKVAKNYGSWNVTQSSGHTAETGHNFAIRVDSTGNASMGSTSYAEVYQRYEGYDLQRLMYGGRNARYITLSFWVKSNRPGRYSVSWYVFTSARRFNAYYDIESPGEWEKKVITIPPLFDHSIVTGNVLGAQLEFWLGLGPNYTSHTSFWQTSYYGRDEQVNFMENNTNEWYITGVQLEPGKVATPFEHRSYGEELALCQRYYYKIGGVTNRTGFATMAAHTTSAAYGIMHYPVTMRSAPTVSLLATNVNYYITGNNTNQNITGFGTEGANRYSCTLLVSGSLSQGLAYWFNAATTSGAIGFDAEL